MLSQLPTMSMTEKLVTLGMLTDNRTFFVNCCLIFQVFYASSDLGPRDLTWEIAIDMLCRKLGWGILDFPITKCFFEPNVALKNKRTHNGAGGAWTKLMILEIKNGA